MARDLMDGGPAEGLVLSGPLLINPILNTPFFQGPGLVSRRGYNNKTMDSETWQCVAFWVEIQ